MIKVLTLSVICIGVYLADSSVLTTKIYRQKSEQSNTLTSIESLKGWKLLFDGKTTNGWRGYNNTPLSKDWIIDPKDQSLMLNAKRINGSWKTESGDIMTDAIYENYELRLDWKIDSCGNSGIIYDVVEDPKLNATYESGMEMQILDNTCHPDAKIIKHRAGDLYDLVSCSVETVKPAGSWNKVRLIQKNGKIEQWMNDVKVVSADMNDASWNTMIAGSKFKSMPMFGKSQKGHIALQNHGNRVWFKNIKIKMI